MPKKKVAGAKPFVRLKCGDCNHAESFHPGHAGCCAFGCKCVKWKKPAKAKTAAAT